MYTRVTVIYFVLYDPIFFFTSEQLFSINAFHVGESFLGRIILSVIYSRFTFWGRLVELYDAVYWNEIKCSESRVANCKKTQRQIIINILLLGSHRFLLYDYYYYYFLWLLKAFIIHYTCSCFTMITS